jgi:hypothetical protein
VATDNASPPPSDTHGLHGEPRVNRRRDEHGRAYYAGNEIPPATEHFAHWRGRLTHPDAVHTPPDERRHRLTCVGGWILSDRWWLHCGICRPEMPK